MHRLRILCDAREGEAGARFVRQLATEAAVNGRLETASTVTSEHRRRPLPRGFCTGPGTVVADDSAGGDVDVVMGNKAAVCAAQTWPHGHAFSLLDHVAAEALRDVGFSAAELEAEAKDRQLAELKARLEQAEAAKAEAAATRDLSAAVKR